jgi:FAD-dependent oxidoreductase domain-containing protein 1
MKTIQTDYLVIGAGLVGSAVTMGLTNLGADRVTLVDLDLSGEWSSSELNAGGVRATWSQKVNLLTSKLSIEYFAKHAERVGYRDCGYLWLHRKDTFDSALKASQMHIENGWPVDVLDVNALRSKVPFIDKTDDLVGGLYGVKDGLVNPNGLKEHFREEAVLKKAKLMDAVWVTGGDAKQDGTTLVKAFQFSSQLSTDQKKALLTTNPETLTASDGEWIQFEAKNVVNCAGAWAPHLAKLLGYHCPSEPVRRQISLFHARDFDMTPFGMIIDPSGVYFHPEAIYGLAGFASQESPGFNFQYDGERFFEEYIWPALYERATVFESLRHVSGWAGLYENSPDHHAIIGKVVGAKHKGNVFEAHSFSGHGAMQSYAVGVALAELMVKGKYETIDLSMLAADRFANGKSISSETWVI